MSEKERKQINAGVKMKLDALKRLNKGENVNQTVMDVGVGQILWWKKKTT